MIHPRETTRAPPAGKRDAPARGRPRVAFGPKPRPAADWPGAEPLGIQRKPATASLPMAAREDAQERQARAVAETADRPAPRSGPAMAPAAAGPVTPTPVPAPLAGRIRAPSAGRPLPPALAAYMASRLGHDFSDVRIHDTARDREDAAQLDAHAFTFGRHVWIGPGQSAEDRRLLAHELTHVVQQRGAPRVQRSLWERFKSGVSSIAGRVVETVSTVASTVVEGARQLAGAAKAAALGKLAGWANDIPGFHLLTVILGRNPITDEPVTRDATNLVRGFLGLLPGGEGLFRNLQQSGALERSFAWLGGQIETLDLSWTTIKRLFRRAWEALSLADLANPLGALKKLKAIFGPPLARLIRFAAAVGRKVVELTFEGVLTLAGPLGKQVLAVLRRAGEVIGTIISDPVGFVANLIRAVVGGFKQFAGNILGHLKAGLTGWLFGALAGAGLQLPQRFDLRGVLSLVLQVLGLTYQALRRRLVKVLSEKRVAWIEKGVAFVKLLVTEGIMGAWRKLLEYVGSLKDRVLGAIKNWVVTRVVVAAVTKLATLFNPAGAVIQAIIAIYNVIRFLIERARQILAVAEAVFESIAQIAAGKLGAAIDFVEQTMARTVPVLISFLARLLGLGGIAEKIQGVIKGLQARVAAAIDRLVAWIVARAKGLIAKGKAVVGKVLRWWQGKREFRVGGEKHTLRFAGNRLMVRSEERPLGEFLATTRKLKIQQMQASEEEKETLVRLYGEAVTLLGELEGARAKAGDAQNPALEQKYVKLQGIVQRMMERLLEPLKVKSYDDFAKPVPYDPTVQAHKDAVEGWLTENGYEFTQDASGTRHLRMKEGKVTPGFLRIDGKTLRQGLDKEAYKAFLGKVIKTASDLPEGYHLRGTAPVAVARKEGTKSLDLTALDRDDGNKLIEKTNQKVTFWEGNIQIKAAGKEAGGWLGAFSGAGTAPASIAYGLDANGHLIGAQFGGSNAAANISLMQGKVNAPTYSQFENTLKNTMVETNVRVTMNVKGEGSYGGKDKDWLDYTKLPATKDKVTKLRGSLDRLDPTDLKKYMTDRPLSYSIEVTAYQEIYDSGGTPGFKDQVGPKRQATMDNPIREEAVSTGQLSSFTGDVTKELKRIREKLDKESP